ncbi:hypothetical protein [uncultured Clostridium sp.]|uniref:hypothetical protein n=1 Tax=uncultured Clostridium sp. TaxID=59620 RepID=UPI0025EBA848|nr:hypothetical protein [uncultured Clostridium sp.]
MGYKKQLSQVIKKLNALKELQKNKINEIKESGKYSEEGKAEFIRLAREEVKGKQEEFKNEALRIIETAKNATLSRKKSVTKDQNFNIQLSNALTVLNTVGKDMSVEELKVLVEPFKEDYYTMQMLRKTVINNDIKGQNEIFEKDNIESDLEVLEEIEKEIPHTFFGDIDQANTMKLSIAMEYYKGSEELEGEENE